MSNFLEVQGNNSVGVAEIESRQLAEMKSKIFLANQFPRNEEKAMAQIMQECQNKRLAENAVYEFKRGDGVVRGASIRLAEVIARHWGNFTCGVTELEQHNGESTVKAYAWDLQTNVSDEKVFTVKHERSTKKGTYKITDSRDVYEMVANNGARRKRACILSVIPSYVVDEAIEQCEKTLAGSINSSNIEEKRQEVLTAFEQYIPENTKEKLEEKIGKEFDKFNAKDITRLKYLYGSIHEGFVKVADAFPSTDAQDYNNIVSDDDAEKLRALNEEIQSAAGDEK